MYALDNNHCNEKLYVWEKFITVMKCYHGDETFNHDGNLSL